MARAEFNAHDRIAELPQDILMKSRSVGLEVRVRIVYPEIRRTRDDHDIIMSRRPDGKDLSKRTNSFRIDLFHGMVEQHSAGDDDR